MQDQRETEHTHNLVSKEEKQKSHHQVGAYGDSVNLYENLLDDRKNNFLIQNGSQLQSNNLSKLDTMRSLNPKENLGENNQISHEIASNQAVEKNLSEIMSQGTLEIPSPISASEPMPPIQLLPLPVHLDHQDVSVSQINERIPISRTIRNDNYASITGEESNEVSSNVQSVKSVPSFSSEGASILPPSHQETGSTPIVPAVVMNGGTSSAAEVDVDIDSILNSPKAKDDIVEKSPGGRYLRFSEKLGSGAYKEVYRAYDTSEGIEVAWNVVNLSGINKAERQYIVNEVRLLEKLNHQNIISFHGSWVNRAEEQVIFVTEILSSGTLKQFIKKVKVIRYKIAKRWAIQILKGLAYLHSQDPPIIHRDLKCDNIFINGTSGDLRIGDLGLCAVMSNSTKALTVLGTPEFMAPELYDESYDEKIDIYAFGMCMLEICTKEVPYRECSNPAQIYKKVSNGVEPESLKRICSLEAQDFIRQCLGKRDDNGEVFRPSASELLDHPFLANRESDDSEIEVYPSTRERTASDAPVSFADIDKLQISAVPDDVHVPLINTVTSNTAAEDVASPRANLSVVSSKGGLSPHLLASIKNSGATEEQYQQIHKQGSTLSTSDSLSYQYVHMPQSESNVKKVKVMMGRDEKLDENCEEEIITPSYQTTSILSDSSQCVAPIPHSVQQHIMGVVENTGLATQAMPVLANSHTVISTNQHAFSGSDQYQNCPLESTLRYMKMASILEDSSTGAPYANDTMHLRLTLKLGSEEQHVQFGFHLVQDDAVQVAREMVKELHLPQDATLEISETISTIARRARIHQDHFHKSGLNHSFSHHPHHAAIHAIPLQKEASQSVTISSDNLFDRTIDSVSAIDLQVTDMPPSVALSSHPHYSMMVPNSTSSHNTPDLLLPNYGIPQGSFHSNQQPTSAPVVHVQSTSNINNQELESIISHGYQHPAVSQSTVHRASMSSIFPQNQATDLREFGVKSISLPDLNRSGDPELSPSLDEDDLFNDDDDDISNSSELKKLAIEHEKKKKRAEKAFHTRLESLQRSKEEKEALHQKTLEKHEKEREALEKRLKQVEEEQQQRLKKLEDEFVQQRAKAKQSVKSYPPLHPNSTADITSDQLLESSVSSLLNINEIFGASSGQEVIPSPTPSHNSSSSLI